MYKLPGYITHYEEAGAIYISSQLLQNKVMLDDLAIQEEFRALINAGGCETISTPLTQFLHEQELLLNEDEIRSALVSFKELLNDTLLLTIMPTEACNFRCPYCYEDHRPVTMGRETATQLQKYIAEQASHFRYVRINWFGGEPTLCKDTLLETNTLVQELQKSYPFQFTSSMTTNGYLLDLNSFKQYYAAGITDYQITLDGWDHDKTRPHVSGEGTLETILGNLTALASLPADEYAFHVILRRNILAGDMDFSWYDHLFKLFGVDNRFSVVVIPVGDWGGETVKELKVAFEEERRNLQEAHEAYLEKIGMSFERTKNSLFSNICYAAYPYGFVFRANGMIEKCTIAQDHPRNCVGHVDPNRGVVLDNAANRRWNSGDLRPECGSCTYVLSCLNLACKKPTAIDGCSEESCPYTELFRLRDRQVKEQEH